MDDQELQFIASQLSCPDGEAGIDVGNKMNELNQFITHKTIEKLSVQKAESIVEIGPGNGSLSVPLLEVLGVDGYYLGIEMSEVMASELNQILENKQCKVEVVCSNCLEVNIAAESIDGVMGVNVLYFIEDLVPFFKHIASWLKSDGRAVFGVRSEKALKNIPFTQYEFNVRSTNEIKSLMKKAGFGSVKSYVFDEGMTSFGDTMISVDSVIIVGEKSKM